MTNFTAIYSTETLKNIQYAFRAKDVESAIEFCKHKFCKLPALTIHNDDTDEDVITISIE